MQVVQSRPDGSIWKQLGKGYGMLAATLLIAATGLFLMTGCFNDLNKYDMHRGHAAVAYKMLSKCTNFGTG